MNKMQRRDSRQFGIPDKHIEDEPRFSTYQNKVTNPFTYNAMQVLRTFSTDIGEWDLSPNTKVRIDLWTIDDGLEIIYMVQGRMQAIGGNDERD